MRRLIRYSGNLKKGSPPRAISTFSTSDLDPYTYTVEAMIKKPSSQGYTHEEISSASCTVVGVEAVSVDASDPNSTKVNYRVLPEGVSIGPVTFSAPGTTQTRNSVSGEFSFTFDQDDLKYGKNTISLEYSSQKVEITATKQRKHTPQAAEIVGAFFAVENVGWRLYTHKLYEIYDKVVYSISFSGKTIFVGESQASLFVDGDYYTENTGNGISDYTWGESHRYVSGNNTTDWKGMRISPPGIENPNTLYKDSADTIWFPPQSLSGEAKITSLLYINGGHLYPAQPLLNRVVDCNISD